MKVIVRGSPISILFFFFLSVIPLGNENISRLQRFSDGKSLSSPSVKNTLLNLKEGKSSASQ